MATPYGCDSRPALAGPPSPEKPASPSPANAPGLGAAVEDVVVPATDDADVVGSTVVGGGDVVAAGTVVAAGAVDDSAAVAFVVPGSDVDAGSVPGGSDVVVVTLVAGADAVTFGAG